MKKIFTLFAFAALAAGAACAQEVIATCECPASKNNAAGTEEFGYYFKKGWGTKPFDLDFKVDGVVKGMDGSYFVNAQVGDQLVFTYTVDTQLTDDSNLAQIQLAAKTAPDWTWTQMFNSVDLPVKAEYPATWVYTIGDSQTVYKEWKDECEEYGDAYFTSAEDELAALKNSGIVVKGQLFYLKKIEIVRPSGAGIADVAVDADAPAEYYNLQGMRVNDLTPGNLYIVRQGGKTAKIVK